MNRFYHILIAIVTAALLTLPLSARAQQQIYPQGLNDTHSMRGIYPGSDAGSCCWIGRRASFDVIAPMGADTLLITVFIPDYAARTNSQRIRLRTNTGAWQERCCFGAGMHEMAFSLGEPLQRPEALSVDLAMSATFVPARLGLNGDPRALSVLLRGVTFKNAQSGERFAAGGTFAMAQPAIDLTLLVLGGLVAAGLTYWRAVAGLAALIVSDPFSLSYYVHGTTVTLPKAVLVGVGVGLVFRWALRHADLTLRQAQGDRGGQGDRTALRQAEVLSRSKGQGDKLWLLLGAQLAFIATMLFASVHAFSHAAAMRETLKALQYALTLVIAYAAYRMDPDELRLRQAFAFTLSIVAVLALFEEFIGTIERTMIHGHVIARIAGPLEGPNQLAGFIGVLLPIVLAFAVLRAPLILERLAIALGGLACVLTISRGGIAALFLAVLLLLVIRYRPNAHRVIAIATCALFAMVLGLAFAEFVGLLRGSALAMFGGTGDRYNGGLGSRPDLWHGAYALWRLHPLFGVGPGNFELLISKYAPGVHTHANSIYFQTLAEQGLLGALALIAVIAASIVPFARRLREPLALGACIAGIAMAFHQTVDCLWLFPKVGVMFWIVLATGAACLDTVAVRTAPHGVQKRIPNESPAAVEAHA